MPDAVVAAVSRSPIGRAVKGSLAVMRPDDLAVQMVQAALAQVPELDPRELDDVMLGIGQPAGEGGNNLARAVAVLAGFDELPGVTVNRYCSSSLQTTRMALHAIRAGEGDAFLSVGVETVSRFSKGTADGTPDTQNPLFAEAAERTQDRALDNRTWTDPRRDGCLPDLYIAMGQTAENVAQLTNVTRQEQDEFAVRSQNLAEAALDNGFWARDIVPVALPDGRLVSADDGPRRGVTYESVSELKPVFRPDGTVTAGNCCALNDGAAALVVMSDTKARELGITPLARIVATAVSGLSPEVMGLGPVEASRRALETAGHDHRRHRSGRDQRGVRSPGRPVLPSARRGHRSRLNVNGGAIAVGHPFGMTGARITSTLVNSLQFHDKTLGLETMCVGGGQGMAMILERLS